MARAEAEALGLLARGEEVDPGLYVGALPFAPGRAAFGLGGGELLSRGAPEQIGGLEPGSRVHVVRWAGKLPGNPVDLLDKVPGGHRIATRGCGVHLYCTQGEWLLVRAGSAAPAFEAPTLAHRTSTSTSSQLARAVLNLVAGPGDRVLDPLCGTGVLVVEAARVGCVALGSDKNGKAAGQAKRNLHKLGLLADLRVVDASALPLEGPEVRDGSRPVAALSEGSEREARERGWPRADAVIADLPYGRRLEVTDLAPLLETLPRLAPRWALIAHLDLSDALRALGHPPRLAIEVPKSTFVRHVFVGGPPRAS